MAHLGLKRLLYYFPNQFLKTPPPRLQTTITHQKRLINTDSQSPTVSANKSSFTVKYLTNSCGLSLQEAVSVSKKFQLQEFKSHNHESVLSLLRSFQFSDTHIKKLVITYPRYLQSNVHNNLKPKLEYLRDIGFVGLLLPDLIVLNASILHRSLSDSMKPTFEFLKKYLRTDEKVVAAIRRYSRLLTFDLKGIMQPNIDFLLSEGVPASIIERQIIRQPRSLMMKLEKIVDAVETVKELGLKPSTPSFLEVTRVLLSMSDSTWKRKVEMFKSFGWSDEEIMSAFKHNPVFLACSEEKIRRAMDFYLNTMKLNRAFIVGCPKILAYGLSTRILPRYNVIKVLESKKLLKEDRKLAWILILTEKKFLKTIIDKHLDQVPNLMELYCGTITVDKID